MATTTSNAFSTYSYIVLPNYAALLAYNFSQATTTDGQLFYVDDETAGALQGVWKWTQSPETGDVYSNPTANTVPTNGVGILFQVNLPVVVLENGNVISQTNLPTGQAASYVYATGVHASPSTGTTDTVTVAGMLSTDTAVMIQQTGTAALANCTEAAGSFSVVYSTAPGTGNWIYFVYRAVA